MNFLSAIGFLTILPVPARAGNGDGKQVLYFPLVGLLIGGMLYGVDHLLSATSYMEVRIVGDVLFLAVISGALHLDGLADSADGLFSHRPREQILEIMKDSRIGVMGVLALVFCVLLKIAGTSGTLQSGSLIWLIIAPALGRTAQVVGLVFANHVASDKILAKQFYQKGENQLLLFCPLPFVTILFFDWFLALVSLAVFILLMVSLLAYFNSRIGGITGDTLGATTEIIETIFLLIGGMNFPVF